MKTLILFIASLAAVFGQQTGYKLNPFTGLLDLAGNGYTAPSGYSATITAQTTTTVTAATHGQGTAPVAYCFDNASPANAVACAYTVSSIGDVVFTWSPAFTGTIIIRGPGADAGAAGNVVGPASSTAGAVAFYSGTSGKVLTQAPTGLFYDSANVRLGVGTGAPSYKVHAVNATSAYLATESGTRKIEIASIAADQNYVVGYGAISFGNTNNNLVSFLQNNTERARFAPTTGNLLLGTTTDDGSNKLQVAGSARFGTTSGHGYLRISPGDASNSGFAELYYPSGTRAGYLGYNSSAVAIIGLSIENATNGFNISQATTSASRVMVWQIPGAELMNLSAAGTLTLQNGTATTGSTSLVVRAGAGQSGNLTTWFDSSGVTALASISAAGNVTSVGGLIAGAGGYIQMNGRALFRSPSDGVFGMYNNAENDFNRLQFGGTTSSFPALKRSSAILQARLADDSAYASMDVASIQVQGLNALTKNGNLLELGASYTDGVSIPTRTPASASAAGVSGTITWDSSYIYIATGTNTWKRVAIATW